MDGPWFDDAHVDVTPYVRVDAWCHLMMETCAALRRVGADESDIAAYRWEALHESDPLTTTARWVSIGPEKGAAKHG